MPCTKTTYDVFEFDSKGTAHPSGKRVTIDRAVISDYYERPTSTVLAFFRQMFGTINTTSGFSASFEGRVRADDMIIIKWKTPHWKLVKVQ